MEDIAALKERITELESREDLTRDLTLYRTSHNGRQIVVLRHFLLQLLQANSEEEFHRTRALSHRLVAPVWYHYNESDPIGPLNEGEHERLPRLPPINTWGLYPAKSPSEERELETDLASFARTNITFVDDTDFLAAVRGLALDKFVINDCYGSHTQVSRTAQYQTRARTAWKSAQDSQMNSWLLKSTPSALTWRSLLWSTPRKRIPASPLPDRLLLTHLIISDYVNAGVVQKPDVGTMARTIYNIKAGGTSGLNALDYLYDPEPLSREVTDGFKELYTFLDGQVTEAEKVRMEWSPICLEHALCKYKHVISEGTFTTYFEPTYYSTQANTSVI
ncbi:hypothetical protein B0H16DRAFT_1815798 [Mycena metata]|uniref:Uncharacterized protein n=1 Tax=Mycena metata TaxID=1033252 RepID=A0AAD7MDA6_9AGAR|nr:hypothetical protein B0H16DRAFT_1815798 [Mycena metata]